MFLVGIMTWWYSDGWRKRAQIVTGRITRTNDYFSVGLLLSTLFAPFRQISAGSVDGPIAAQIRAMTDKLLSRVIGAVVRTFMIIFGLVVIILQGVFGLVILIFWAVIPVFPVLGLVMMVIGWVPSWL
jgi:hypothetical protein